MLSLELCLKRKRIRSAVQFRSCLFSYASTGSWSSCDSLHTWSRAAGELCVHYFSAVQSHSSQARRDYWVSIDVSWIAAVTPRSYFEMWHYLRLLQRRWNVFEIKQIKIYQADVEDLEETCDCGPCCSVCWPDTQAGCEVVTGGAERREVGSRSSSSHWLFSWMLYSMWYTALFQIRPSEPDYSLLGWSFLPLGGTLSKVV